MAERVPGRHKSPEGDAGRTACRVPVQLLGFTVANPDSGRAYPQWVPVEDDAAAVLEGVVAAKADAPDAGPNVAVGDLPTSHHTHDMCFPIKPDETPDNRFTNLLGTQVHADGHESTQPLIGIEWESGLGADNDGNPAAAPNRKGDSFGYYSAGHRRGDTIWNWPTEGDRIHVEGLWIWDRAHPPSKTELHPARLTAITRDLPDVGPDGDGPVATRCDIFASGDGGAHMNNLPGTPEWVKRVKMSAKDYVFDVTSRFPRPARTATLRWDVETHPGDNFTPPLDVSAVDDTTVRVRVPWKSAGVPDNAILARTLRLTWRDREDKPIDPPVQRFRVTLDEYHVLKTHDMTNGEYRSFAEVAGQWVFLNELLPVSDILRDGLGDTPAPATYKLARSFIVAAAPGQRFRIHSDGWEADGINASFGHLINPHHPCDETFKQRLNGMIAPFVAHGGRDDAIGATRAWYGPANDYGLGLHADVAREGVRDRTSGRKARLETQAQKDAQEEGDQPDLWTGEDTDPDNSYILRYRIEAF
jgi:hypothetical protein